MQFPPSIPRTAAAIAACCGPATTGMAQEFSELRPAEACLQTVDAIGASMGHREFTTVDGRTAYRFVVRANGLDYAVTCDPATGVVSDVAPRQE